MRSKRRIIEALLRSELVDAGVHRGLSRRAPSSELIPVLSGARDVKIEDLIGGLSARRLAAIHADLGLGAPAAGAHRAAVIAAIIGRPERTIVRGRRRRTEADALALIKGLFRGVRRVAPIREASDYFVTDDGRVVSLARLEPRLCRVYRRTAGPPMVSVRVRGRSTFRSLPRLVARAFVEPPKDVSMRSLVARSLDGNRLNCRAENLSWVTHSRKTREQATVKRVRSLSASARASAQAVRRAFPGEGAIRAIRGFPSYVVSERGRVYSLWNPKPRLLEAVKNPRGSFVRLRIGTMLKSMRVAQVVAMAFIGPSPGPHYVVRHKNGDARDCRATNLQWKRREVPVIPKGAVSDDAVRAIRALTRAGESARLIARIFGIGAHVVQQIKEGRLYRRVRDAGTDPLAALSRELAERIELETRVGASKSRDGRAARELDAAQRCAGEGVRLARVAQFPDYFVSDDGRFISVRRWPPCVLTVHRTGNVRLARVKRRFETLRADQVVAEAFLDRPTSAALVLRHKDGDLRNNRASNLEWAPPPSPAAPPPPEPVMSPEARIRVRFPELGELRCVGEAPGLWVSQDGRVFSVARQVPREIRRGDGKVAFVDAQGVKRVWAVRRLVASAFDPTGARAGVWKAPRAPRSPVPIPAGLALVREAFGDGFRLAPIPKFPDYFIDDQGRLYSVRSGVATKLAARRGAPILRSPNDESVELYTPALVAAAFLPPRPSVDALLVRRNGDASDHRAENLVWGSGVDVARRKRRFDADAVKAIRTLIGRGHTAQAVAKAAGVSRTTIVDIISRERYADVPDGVPERSSLPMPLRRLI